ncbi:hypothetical protein DFH09DRAFT_1342452 [Mycena vulgaris]|nr:hypothetical protein DFH09DRAFT_1342452 [Mycena vulgaris]
MDDYHGLPRLHPREKDEELLRHPRLAEAFAAQEKRRVRRGDAEWQQQLAQAVLSDPGLAVGLGCWVYYSIAFEIAPFDAALLLCACSAQIKAFKDQCGPQVNVHDQHEVAADSPFENSEEEMIIQDSAVEIPGLNALLQTATEINFFCLDGQDPVDAAPQDEAVQVLREMRRVRERKYQGQEFVDAFKKTGLCDTLAIVTDPHTRREVKLPMAYRFTPTEGRICLIDWAQLYSSGSEIIHAITFVHIMCDTRFQRSTASSCHQVYFLSFLDNWKEEFKRWIGPTIAAMELQGLPDVKNWNIVRLFRDLCALDVDTLNLGALEAVSVGLEMAKKVLSDAQQERSGVKRVNREVHRPDKAAPGAVPGSGNPPGNSKQSTAQKVKAQKLGSTPATAHTRHQKPPRNIASINLSYDEASADRCILHLSQKRVSEAELAELKGALFTCADADDVFQTTQKASHAALGRKVVSPTDRGHIELAPREDVLARCKRDIWLIEEEETSKLVGGVLWGAWSRDTLEEMRRGHEQVAHYAKEARRTKKSQVAGKLRPVSSGRQPMGGIPGDGYGPYAYQSTEDLDGVDALFAAARDSDTLMETQRREEAGVNNMGRTGMNSFYCWEYASPLHEDDDDMWSICCQLWKSGRREDEYNFSYAEWGVDIKTQENTVWFFNPRHLHGTILPRKSSVEWVISRGTHTTMRRRDLDKATLLKDVRETYEGRAAFRNAYICK